MQKNLFDRAHTDVILDRLARLRPESPAQWGKMNVAQMFAHCERSLATAMGDDVIPPVSFVGRLIGRLLKPTVLSEKPLGKGSPTDKSYKITDVRDFETEKTKLIASIKRFQAGGPPATTKHPHPFFGHFTAEEWAIFEWKHLDHHLRQFGG